MKATWSVFFMALAIGMSSCFKNSEDPNAQLNAEVKLIDEYLQIIGETDVLYDNSTGLRFVIDDYGDDAPAHKGQNVVVQYTGKTFTSSGVSTTPFDFGEIDDNLDDVLPSGLQYAISVMLKGASGTVYIPSKYGFGETGTTGVPANTTLVYNLYIEEVTRTVAQQNQLQADTATIRNYLDANTIAATLHPSGFYYVINEPPTASGYPNPYSIVTFDYTLKLLSAPGTVVQQNTLTNQGVFSLIDGLKIGFPFVGVGSKVTFYFPSTLGYGTTAQTGIPANSNLIFEIKLTSVAQ